MDLVTIEDVRSLLGPNFGVQGDQALLELISSVSGEVETWLDRKVFTTTYTEQLDIRYGEWKFYLRAYPVTSVTSVHNDYDRVFPASTLISTTDYYVDLANGVLNLDRATLSTGVGVLKIVYVGGMALTTAAFKAAFPDISGAVAMEVAARWIRKNHPTVTNASLGNTAVTVVQKTQFLDGVEKALEPHQRIVYAR